MRIRRGRIPTAAAVGLAGVLSVAACTTVQTTSGGDYVAARPEWAAAQGVSAKPGAAGGSIERAVFEAANAEPLLRFPARIGLARIHQGRLTTVPPGEADAWLELIRTRGAAYGEFVPVSPLVAQLTAASVAGRDTVRSAVDTIRIGAARQHLDAVLVYEVAGGRRDNATPLSVLDLTIVGNFLVPSRALQGRATAAAMLIDVRNGYPYASTSAQAEEDGVWTNSGSTDRSMELMRRTEVEAVRRLTIEVGNAMERLRADLDRRDPNRLRAEPPPPAPPAKLTRRS